MIFRTPKPSRLPGRRLWYYCCMIFTPPLASKFSESIGAGADYETVLIERDTPTRPYLQVVGPPPLRFGETAPPPDLAGRPPAAAPPLPLTTAAPAVKPAAPPPPVPVSAAVAPKPAKPTPPAVTAAGPGATPAAAETPAPAIIEDELRPRVRAEEFLPFFQLPAPGLPGSQAPEAPGQIPPSSATYQQR